MLSGSGGCESRAQMVLWAAAVTPGSDLARSAGTGDSRACNVNCRMQANLPHVPRPAIVLNLAPGTRMEKYSCSTAVIFE